MCVFHTSQKNENSSNLNPEPIDSSPDLLTNCGEDATDGSSKGTEISLTYAALQNISNVKGMITFIGHLDVWDFRLNIIS